MSFTIMKALMRNFCSDLGMNWKESNVKEAWKLKKFWFVDLDNGWERVDDVQIVLFEGGNYGVAVVFDKTAQDKIYNVHASRVRFMTLAEADKFNAARRRRGSEY